MARDRRTLKRKSSSKADAPTASRNKTAAELDEIRRATEKQIDKFMKKAGDSTPLLRTDEEGWRWFEYRSVRGRAGIVQSESDGAMYLRVESLVMELAPEGELDVQLLRELLQMNMTVPSAARIGITNEGVFAIATLPVAELRAGDVATHIRAVMALATNLANPRREQVTPEGLTQEEIPPEKSPDPSPQVG